MFAIATALLYALFVWWFATGVVLLLVLRQRRVVSLVVATVLFPVSLYLLHASGPLIGVRGAYLGFTAAILLWGTQEIAFLTGAVTGPRPEACPPGAVGLARLRFAIAAILYHELALVCAGALVLAVTSGAANQVGALTFLVLWVMRISAKLNLFLGVPVLNDEVLPRPIAFLRSYFMRGPVNGFFPIAVVGSVLTLSALVTAAANPDISSGAEIGYVLVAALMSLAILEHVFMLVPLPLDRLWAWSMGDRARTEARTDEPARGSHPTEIERVVVPTP